MSKPFVACAVCSKIRLCELHHTIPGGVECLALCTPCHDMIDRIPLDQWDPHEAWRGITEICEKCGPEGRLAILKLAAVAGQAVAALKTYLNRVKPQDTPAKG